MAARTSERGRVIPLRDEKQQTDPSSRISCRNEMGGVMKNDPHRETRIRVSDLLDRHCKGCELVAGLRETKFAPQLREICDVCEIGQELRQLGQTLQSGRLIGAKDATK